MGRLTCRICYEQCVTSPSWHRRFHFYLQSYTISHDIGVNANALVGDHLVLWLKASRCHELSLSLYLSLSLSLSRSSTQYTNRIIPLCLINVARRSQSIRISSLLSIAVLGSLFLVAYLQIASRELALGCNGPGY
jgi:hypothetical protein